MARSILVAGETLVDFLPPNAGPPSDVEEYRRRPGGAPANVAVALSRLEHEPLFWTRVGADPFGRYLEHVLREHGLPDRFVERDPEAKTTLAFVTRDETGDRAFSFYRERAADTRMQPGTVDGETLENCEWVHAGGVALAAGRSREATRDLLARAADRECTVSFDPNVRPELWPDERTVAAVVGDVLEHVSLLTATADELGALGFEGETARERAAAALESGPHTVVVTRGGEGALAVTGPDSPWNHADPSGRGIDAIEHGGYEVETVDTTGAGDAFVAGTIAALREGRTLEGALAYANAVGAAATTAVGAMAALPDRAAVERVVESDE